MSTVNVGDSVSVTAYDVASKPKWLKWTTGANLAGKAQTPSGHRRLVTLDGVNQWQKADYYVNPIYAGGY